MRNGDDGERDDDDEVDLIIKAVVVVGLGGKEYKLLEDDGDRRHCCFCFEIRKL